MCKKQNIILLFKKSLQKTMEKNNNNQNSYQTLKMLNYRLFFMKKKVHENLAFTLCTPRKNKSLFK
jgi:hypothetical protein